MFVNNLQNRSYKLRHLKERRNKFDLFFKLLFLLPDITIKSLLKLVMLIKRLSFDCRKMLMIKIFKKFYSYYRVI